MVPDGISAISMKRRFCWNNIHRLLQLHPSRSADLLIVTKSWDRVQLIRSGAAGKTVYSSRRSRRYSLPLCRYHVTYMVPCRRSAISTKRRVCSNEKRRLLQLHPSRSADLRTVTSWWDRVKRARTGIQIMEILVSKHCPCTILTISPEKILLEFRRFFKEINAL